MYFPIIFVCAAAGTPYTWYLMLIDLIPFLWVGYVFWDSKRYFKG
tara:strand:+ start:234 stop:368 length:135 start_codon:yes stop_codon:yes gene_type:complete